MNKQEFLNQYIDWFPENRNLCEEHITDFPEILLHIFAGFAINEKMVQSFEKNETKQFEKYCNYIEYIWNQAYVNDYDEILNVISVTILERISDDKTMWQRFGGFISEPFKKYINEIILTENIMMASVECLK